MALSAKRGNAGARASNRCVSGWFGFSEFSDIGLIDGALVFKGRPGRLELDLHQPLPDHASIRSYTLTKEGRIWRVALQLQIEGGRRPRGAPKSRQPGRA